MHRCPWPVLSPLVSLLLLAPAASAQLAPYWLPDPGCSLTIGSEVWSTESPLILHIQGGTGVWSDEIYVFDTDADLCLQSTRNDDPTNPGSDVWSTYDPPLKVLDYPLAEGKSWSTSGTQTSTPGGGPVAVSMTGTVGGTRTVDTVLGPLQVVEFVLGYTSPAGTVTYTYLLHEQLGVVNDLVAVSGCDVVPTTDTSWSGLKAEYR